MDKTCIWNYVSGKFTNVNFSAFEVTDEEVICCMKEFKSGK